VALDAGQNSATGELTDGGANTAAVNAWRKSLSPAAFAARYGFTLQQPNADPALPQGNGTGSVKFDLSGNVLVAGILPDNSAFTGSTFVGPEGQVLIYQSLYSDGGSLVGAPAITAAASIANNTIAGELSWSAPAIPATKKTPARPAFGPISVTLDGSVVAP
jgi:hypothetical protein